MTASGHDEFYAVVRDEGERIRAFVTMLSSYAVAEHDEWDPIMIMLGEIDARLDSLVNLACEEGHDLTDPTEDLINRAAKLRDLSAARLAEDEEIDDKEPVLGNRKLLNAVVDMLRKNKRASIEPIPDAELVAADEVLGKPTVLAIIQVEAAAEPC